VPAAVGLRDKLKTPDDRALEQPSEHQNGVNLILQTLQDSRDKVAILFVGSARDVAVAYNRQPALFRDKVRSLHGFIGDAGDPTHREWNVTLDPQAFVRLMRADVPFHWIPCFDGGRGPTTATPPSGASGTARCSKRSRRRCSATFCTCCARQPTIPSPTSRNPPARGSRLADARSAQPLVRRVARTGGGAAVASRRTRVVGFSPVELSADDHGVVRYGPAPGSRSVLRFEIKNQARFAEAATRATAQLLESFPVRERP